MKTLVVYTSKYGSTEKYARWISDALGCPMQELKKTSEQDLSDCDAIIYAGGIYAGLVSGFKKFLTKLGSPQDEKVKQKKLVVAIVGMTNPADTEFYDTVIDQNIAPEWRNLFKAFALRGDRQFSKMNGMHKMIMRMVKSEREKTPLEDRSSDDAEFIENFGKDALFASVDQIQPVLDFLEEE